MAEKKKKPEWVPENGGKEYASNVRKGVDGTHDGMPGAAAHNGNDRIVRRKNLNTDDYVNGVLKGDRVTLARTITLIESNAPSHLAQAQEVLGKVLPHSGNSIRIGITGVPGAGKSTFIEAFGLYLIEHGHKVAVLAVDPSSSVSRGSILGDKTRMEKLSRKSECFIRPSPTGGALGGVARKTRESILVCEAAGYDVILVETVGVGQNEITVRSMVDFFLLMQIAGGGDELQGIKKGVMEIADALIVNKADGDNKKKAELARQEYAMALHYMAKATRGWETKAFTCSAITGTGIDKIWQVITRFKELVIASGLFSERRNSQIKEWLYSMVSEYLENIFFSRQDIQKAIPGIEKAVLQGHLPVTQAAQKLLKMFESH